MEENFVFTINYYGKDIALTDVASLPEGNYWVRSPILNQGEDNPVGKSKLVEKVMLTAQQVREKLNDGSFQGDKIIYIK